MPNALRGSCLLWSSCVGAARLIYVICRWRRRIVKCQALRRKQPCPLETGRLQCLPKLEHQQKQNEQMISVSMPLTRASSDSAAQRICELAKWQAQQFPQQQLQCRLDPVNARTSVAVTAMTSNAENANAESWPTTLCACSSPRAHCRLPDSFAQRYRSVAHSLPRLPRVRNLAVRLLALPSVF